MRIYIYFSDLRIHNSLFSVKGNFFSADGEQYETFGTMISTNGIAKTPADGRFWFFDIPEKSKTSVFTINSGNNVWSTSGLFKIDGCTFEYATAHYSDIGSQTGWHKIAIFMDQFADYFLSRIDVGNNSRTNGFMAYDLLSSSLYDGLADFDIEREKHFFWDDEFIGYTSFEQKWQLVRELYQNNYHPETLLTWPFFEGAILLIIAGFLTFNVLREIFWKKIKNEKFIN